MENKDHNENSITIHELLTLLLGNWKYLLLLGAACSVLAVFYYSFFTEKTYTSKVIISSNLKDRTVVNYFGEYEILEDDFSVYLKLLEDPNLIRETLDSLGSRNISVGDIIGGLKVDLSNDEKVLQTSFPISLELRSPEVVKILNLHISNFIDYINDNESIRMIEYFKSKFELSRSQYIEKLSLTKKSIVYYDSLLATVSSDEDVFGKINKESLKDIFLLKGTFINNNYLNLESEIIGFKKDLYNYQIGIKNYNMYLDSLSQLKNLYENKNINYFDPFSFKLKLIKKAYDVPVVNAPNVIKKAILFFMLGSFIYLLIFVSRIYFRL